MQRIACGQSKTEALVRGRREPAMRRREQIALKIVAAQRRDAIARAIRARYAARA
jgi:hypothetical protein